MGLGMGKFRVFQEQGIYRSVNVDTAWYLRLQMENKKIASLRLIVLYWHPIHRSWLSDLSSKVGRKGLLRIRSPHYRPRPNTTCWGSKNAGTPPYSSQRLEFRVTEGRGLYLRSIQLPSSRRFLNFHHIPEIWKKKGSFLTNFWDLGKAPKWPFGAKYLRFEKEIEKSPRWG